MLVRLEEGGTQCVGEIGGRGLSMCYGDIGGRGHPMCW